MSLSKKASNETSITQQCRQARQLLSNLKCSIIRRIVGTLDVSWSTITTVAARRTFTKLASLWPVTICSTWRSRSSFQPLSRNSSWKSSSNSWHPDSARLVSAWLPKSTLFRMQSGEQTLCPAVGRCLVRSWTQCSCLMGLTRPRFSRKPATSLTLVSATLMSAWQCSRRKRVTWS